MIFKNCWKILPDYFAQNWINNLKSKYIISNFTRCLNSSRKIQLMLERDVALL